MGLFKKKGAGFQPALFQEEKKAVRNPGRGFYEIHTFALGAGGDHGLPWDLENLRWCIKEGHSLALVLLDIKKARDRELTDEELKCVDGLLAAFDTLDVDVILRPVYDREGRGIENEPALLSRVVRHMEQLSPVIMAHRKKILLIQGLLVGSWGEMHTSKFLHPQALESLADVWLENTDLYLAVRTPAQHRLLSEGGENKRIAGRYEERIALRCEERIAGRYQERIALYNDGLFGSETDMGTYADYEKDIAYLYERCGHVPNGGEAVSGAGYPEPEAVIERLRQLHLSYLNSAHDVKMLDHFRMLRYQGESLYDYIEAHLGYRFVIRKAEGKLKNGELNLRIEIENTGFGNLCQEALLSLVLEEDGERREQSLAEDPRRWEPGARVTVEAKLTPRTGVILYLWLRRKWDGKTLQFANQGQREGLAVLGKWGEVRSLRS